MPKEVSELAKTDTFEATLLAVRGRRFTEIETLLSLYYQTLREFRKIESGQKTSMELIYADDTPRDKEIVSKSRGLIPKTLQDLAHQISQVLIDAINSRDASKAFEIAEAIDFLKTFKPSGDPIRYLLLALKGVLQDEGEKWKIGKVALFVQWPVEDKAHGYPGLRRICKELDFPLESTPRQIRRRKRAKCID